MAILNSLHAKETAVEEGKAFAYAYTTNRDMSQLVATMSHAYKQCFEDSGSKIVELDELLNAAWEKYMHTNALNPLIYPSLRKMENEVVSMTTMMLNGDSNCAGSLTSGGTESILMAVKTYRDRARAACPHITNPNMVVATTIHPAFEKAAHYFDVEIIHVEINASDARINIDEVRKAINSSTILLVGSAPQYCHGVIDCITDLSDLALKHNVGLHVDACFGGFMLPWVEKLGHAVPLWDFRVPGVTSVSADIHKYGYSSKGASVVVYRTEKLRSFQYLSYAEWPGGLFVSPSMAGSRPGGMIASAWVALNAMGESGYMELAKRTMATTDTLVQAFNSGSIPCLSLRAPPNMTCIAIVSKDPTVNILAVADVMDGYGWKMERQQYPESLHMTMMPHHAHVVDKLVADLTSAVETVKANPELNNTGTTGVYGMVATIPDKTIVKDFLLKFFSSIYTLEPGSKSILEDHVDVVKQAGGTSVVQRS